MRTRGRRRKFEPVEKEPGHMLARREREQALLRHRRSPVLPAPMARPRLGGIGNGVQGGRSLPPEAVAWWAQPGAKPGAKIKPAGRVLATTGGRLTLCSCDNNLWAGGTILRPERPTRHCVGAQC